MEPVKESHPKGNGKHDVWTHRIIVLGMVLTVLMGLASEVYLEAIGRPVPKVLGYMASGAAGALSMALASIFHKTDRKG